MHITPALHSLAWIMAAAITASPLGPRQGVAANGTNVVPALWDGTCFYPRPVPSFDLASYLGTWYQVAGYEAAFSAGCKCITANYTLNGDGTVGVRNQCQALGRPVTITGSAAPVDPVYGDAGAFAVTFFNASNICPGPNYIVQEYVAGDYAIVQSPDFATLFILSREQNVQASKLHDLMTRATQLGSKKSLIEVNDQTGCLYT